MLAKTQLTLILPGMAPILAQEINRNLLPESLSKIVKKSKFEKTEICVVEVKSKLVTMVQ